MTPRGPSAAAGLQPGDVITALDGEAAVSADQLQALTLTKRPGDTVRVTYVRAGTQHTVSVTLGPQPPPQ